MYRGISLKKKTHPGPPVREGARQAERKWHSRAQCPSDVQCTCGAVQSSKAAFNALKRGSRTAKQWFNALRAFNAAELRFKGLAGAIQPHGQRFISTGRHWGLPLHVINLRGQLYTQNHKLELLEQRVECQVCLNNPES